MDSRVKNPRVLMLIENLSFPMDRRMRQEAGALRDAGYEVTVICPRGGRVCWRSDVARGDSAAR